MEEKRGIKNFEATHSGGDRADAEEACYTANSAIASTKHRQRQSLSIHYAIAYRDEDAIGPERTISPIRQAYIISNKN